MARILVIDDEPDNREVISTLLLEEGYEVQTAWSSENALAILAGIDFDVIITDINLPGISGLRSIAEIRRVSKARILVMTGQDDKEMRDDAKALGAEGFLPKPLDFTALRFLLKTLTKPPL